MTRLLFALLLLASVANAQEPFLVESTSCVFVAEAQEYRFTITFNQAPDFWTKDYWNYQKHNWFAFVGDDYPMACQDIKRFITSYYIMSGRNWIMVEAAPDCRYPIIMGEYEICTGESTATAPYGLVGSTLTFSIPASGIGDFDGHITYRIFTRTYQRYDSNDALGASTSTTPTTESTWGSIKTRYGN